jgi:hypothetical protein
MAVLSRLVDALACIASKAARNVGSFRERNQQFVNLTSLRAAKKGPPQQVGPNRYGVFTRRGMAHIVTILHWSDHKSDRAALSKTCERTRLAGNDVLSNRVLLLGWLI